MRRPDVRTPGGSGQANADRERADTVIVAQHDEQRKAAATLQARAALAGIALHRLDGGGWLACRWGLARELADADEAARWLRTMGV